MRIAVHGSSPTASVLRTSLETSGYVVSDQQPQLTIDIDTQEGESIVIDTPDCRLGRLATHRVAELAPGGGVRVLATGRNRDDKALRVVVPFGDLAASHAVERGVVRAVDQWVAQEVTGARQASPATLALRLDSLHGELTALRVDLARPWWRKVFG